MKLKRRPADSFNFKDIKDITFDELLSVFKDRIVFLNSECWRWLGETHINNDSIYPRVKINGKYYAVHRLFYEKRYNIILDENDAHHKCAFTLCINPKHIEALKASIHKSNHFTKLTKEQEREIVELYKKGDSCLILARKYKVVHRTILNILSRNNIKISHRNFTHKLPLEDMKYIKTYCETSNKPKSSLVKDMEIKYSIGKGTVYRIIQYVIDNEA